MNRLMIAVAYDEVEIVEESGRRVAYERRGREEKARGHPVEKHHKECCADQCAVLLLSCTQTHTQIKAS